MFDHRVAGPTDHPEGHTIDDHQRVDITAQINCNRHGSIQQPHRTRHNLTAVAVGGGVMVNERIHRRRIVPIRIRHHEH